jgi:hypothetical protein
MSERPAGHRALWHTKPIPRAHYEDCYRHPLEHCAPGGPVLEIRGGTGNLKAFRADIVSSARASSSSRGRSGPPSIASGKTGKRA